jgi:hypothetical protein
MEGAVKVVLQTKSPAILFLVAVAEPVGLKTGRVEIVGPMLNLPGRWGTVVLQ